MKKSRLLFGKITMFIVILICSATIFGGCREADKVKHNISVQADNFNVVRRLTVVNARTDTVLLQLTGTFALKNNNSNELEVICELADGTYQKHFVYLNEYTLYVVEDLSGCNVSKYSYELNFLPLVVPDVKIVGVD